MHKSEIQTDTENDNYWT